LWISSYMSAAPTKPCEGSLPLPPVYTYACALPTAHPVLPGVPLTIMHCTPTCQDRPAVRRTEANSNSTLLRSAHARTHQSPSPTTEGTRSHLRTPECHQAPPQIAKPDMVARHLCRRPHRPEQHWLCTKHTPPLSLQSRFVVVGGSGFVVVVGPSVVLVTVVGSCVP